MFYQVRSALDDGCAIGVRLWKIRSHTRSHIYSTLLECALALHALWPEIDVCILDVEGLHGAQ